MIDDYSEACTRIDRCFTRRHRGIVISPRRHGASPICEACPVDEHGGSPTFACGPARWFTHRRHGGSPTGTPRKASNGAGLQNRNARARFLTLKIFNGPVGASAVDNIHSAAFYRAPVPCGHGEVTPLRGLSAPPMRHLSRVQPLRRRPLSSEWPTTRTAGRPRQLSVTDDACAMGAFIQALRARPARPKGPCREAASHPCRAAPFAAGATFHPGKRDTSHASPRTGCHASCPQSPWLKSSANDPAPKGATPNTGAGEKALANIIKENTHGHEHG